jgi:eukaryotic-like serine/threonine-protein kinase
MDPNNDDTTTLRTGATRQTAADQESMRTQVPLRALRGVEDPTDFAHQLQAWRSAATDRNRLPRYRVIKRLGHGSQGLVFSVADRDCLREVALKTLNGGSQDPGDISRFIHEAQITAQLEHPSIVPVHDVGVLPDGTVFYTMKRIEGLTLADRLGDASGSRAATAGGDIAGPARLTMQDIAQVGLRIAEAMAFAHSRNVIHRDLKPRNVMIGRYGEVLVLDWGLAKIISSGGSREEDSTDGQGRAVLSLRSISDSSSDGEDEGIHATNRGTAIGTPAFMSPEQARGEPADRRSDIYSLGVLLYHALSGESPYERGRLRHTLEQVAHGRWTPLHLREGGRSVPRALVAIVHGCMAHDAAKRYQTMDAVVADLRSWMAGGTVSTCPETPAERALRLVRQQRVAALVLTAALICVAVGWGFIQWEQGQARTAQMQQLRQTAARHELMGDLQSARRDLERLADIDPSARDAQQGLERLRQRLQQQSDEAISQRMRAEIDRLVREARQVQSGGTASDVRRSLECWAGALALAPHDVTIREGYREALTALLTLETRLPPGGR